MIKFQLVMIILLVAIVAMSMAFGWDFHTKYNLYCYDYSATDCVTQQETLDLLIRARNSHLIDEPFHQQWVKNYDMIINYIQEQGQ